MTTTNRSNTELFSDHENQLILEENKTDSIKQMVNFLKG